MAGDNNNFEYENENQLDETRAASIRKTLGVDKAHFILATDSTIAVSTDANNPTYITSFEEMSAYGFTLRESDGAMQNTSGRDIAGITGNIAVQVEITGGTKTMSFWTEVSTDGVAFTPIATSLRQREVASTNESFTSTVSFTASWPAGYYVRLAFHSSGNTMSFDSPSFVTDGDTITGQSVVWELTEQ